MHDNRQCLAHVMITFADIAQMHTFAALQLPMVLDRTPMMAPTTGLTAALAITTPTHPTGHTHGTTPM